MTNKRRHATSGASMNDGGTTAREDGPTDPRAIGKVVVQSVIDLARGNVLEWAAALAYYALLSLFPLALVATLLASRFVDSDWALDQATDLLGGFLPQGENEVREALESGVKRRQVGLISGVLLVWSGTRVFGVLTKALNSVSDVDDESDSFGRRMLVQMGLLSATGVLFGLALATDSLLDAVVATLSFLPGRDGALTPAIAGFSRALLLVAAFFLIYWLVPRGKRYGRAALSGAMVATALYLAARPLFLVFVRRYGRFEEVYGWLALVVILLIWAWIVAVLTLFGGSLASHIKTMLIEGESAAEAERRHA